MPSLMALLSGQLLLDPSLDLPSDSALVQALLRALLFLTWTFRESNEFTLVCLVRSLMTTDRWAANPRSPFLRQIYIVRKCQSEKV